MRFSHRFRILVALIAICLGDRLWACNIPVFRYALERWRPDRTSVYVFHQLPLTEQQQLCVQQLKVGNPTDDNTSRIELNQLDTTQPIADAVARDLWSTLSGDPGRQPQLIVLTGHQRGRVQYWNRSLDSTAVQGLLDSPIRKTLRERLLNGHAIVWLVCKSQLDQNHESVLKMLDEQCSRLPSRLQLPEGIGEPGSELYAQVPLLLKFTTLVFDGDDPAEQFLVELFRKLRPDAKEKSLVIPVFGRGRALEVIPSDLIDAELIEELTQFLCGACSCQVKESNPGLDLLVSVDWDRELFGDSGLLPPPPKAADENSPKPKLLQIAPGRKRP